MNWKELVEAERKSGSFERTIRILDAELAKRPRDPEVYYQIGWTHDALGREADAAPAYEKAIELGLQGEELQGAYIGLGSTLRCLGRYSESLAVLDAAIAEFSGHRVLRVFRALTLFNLKRFDESTATLIKDLAETSADASIQRYARALNFYSDKLDQVFE